MKLTDDSFFVRRRLDDDGQVRLYFSVYTKDNPEKQTDLKMDFEDAALLCALLLNAMTNGENE